MGGFPSSTWCNFAFHRLKYNMTTMHLLGRSLGYMTRVWWSTRTRLNAKITLQSILMWYQNPPIYTSCVQNIKHSIWICKYWYSTMQSTAHMEKAGPFSWKTHLWCPLTLCDLSLSSVMAVQAWTAFINPTTNVLADLFFIQWNGEYLLQLLNLLILTNTVQFQVL